MAEGQQHLYGPGATGTGKAMSDKIKLWTLLELVNDRFGTDFDAQDLIDEETGQLVADEAVDKAARANDPTSFGHAGKEAWAPPSF